MATQLIRRFAPLTVQVLVGLVLAAIPFFRVGGYKSMLLMGIVGTLSLPLAWMSPERMRAGPSVRGSLAYLGLSLIPPGMLLIAGWLFTKGCELSDGLAMVGVGLLPGALLSYAIVHAVRRRWLYAIIWFLLLAAGGWTFLSEPVYRVDHVLIGMLLGPPNEKPKVTETRALWFAVEVLLWAAVVAGASGTSLALRRRAADIAQRWGRLALPVLTVLVAGLALVAVRSHDAELGYRIDREHLEERLRDHRQGAGLTHYMSPRIPSDARPWLVLDAEFERDQQKKLLGLEEAQTPPATIFWYANRNEKRDLTGAGRTKFAKVHLREFAVTAQQFPARTLNHEMAHVTSGAFSDTPLQVPGRLGGLWYNPLLVEGFAVAVAWTDYPLSAHEQARIAIDKGRAPEPEALFNPLGFATNNLSVAYRISGSFVRFCMDNYGVDKVLAWYGSEDFESAVGVPIDVAEQAWREMLAALTIREQDKAGVDKIQSRPPISKESCGTSKDERDLRSAMSSEADDEVERILGSRPQTAATWFAQRRYEAQRSNYVCELPQEPPVKLGKAEARRYAWMRAISAWARGENDEAAQLFAALPDRTRISGSVIMARALLRDGHPATDLYFDAPVEPTTHYTRRWAETGHPLLGYQLAVRLSGSQRWESLDRVMRKLDFSGFEFVDGEEGTILLKVHDMRAKAAFALRDWDRAEASFTAFREAAPTQGRRAYADTWLARVAWFRTHESRLSSNLPRL